MKKRYLIIASTIMFLVSMFLYLFEGVTNIDNLVYDFIISVKSDMVTNIMKIITFFASVEFIIFIMIILLILSIVKKQKIFNIVNLMIILNTIVNRIVKIIIKRERPKLINLIQESSYSFPSGHTMIAVTIYGFLIYLCYKNISNKWIKYILIGILSIMIILIMISRIYLGVHYFSDVIAGFFLSLAYLLFCIGILERKNII